MKGMCKLSWKAKTAVAGIGVDKNSERSYVRRRNDRVNASQEAILEAATKEFLENGFSGTKIAAVARRAGYNKTLVYRHFRDKEGLFEAVLHREIRRRHELTTELPDELGEIIWYWYREAVRNPRYVPLLLREAMDMGNSEPLDIRSRKGFYEEHLRVLRLLQDKGVVSKDLDVECLLLAIGALAFFPVSMPQVVKLVADSSLHSPGFENRWKQFLLRLGDSLR
jgi:AcrR family transcriptional regulator